ncbi:hypothetical protein [Knoellia subterranea]|uniref:Uncharacterized protein n=1 Tax=Knoellia subterranea KCTC 19937 TaxID=1385521 RepID=A0A0A0JU44_9MICO|nr:hypothetical protein [Knoellia subterranea]KGN39582.1 hypothetical protein N803_01725 [Knoellia subterranea KCTC 19937]
MRIRDFWRSAWNDNIFGFRFVVGMCGFWFGPLMFGTMGFMTRPQKWAMVAWAAVAAVGWLGAWVVMLGRHFRSAPGTHVDLTPTKPMLLPAALMVGGIVGCLLSF